MSQAGEVTTSPTPTPAPAPTPIPLDISKEELELKLHKCLKQLNDDPLFTAKDLNIKRSLEILVVIEESLNLVITETTPVADKLTFIYSKTTGDAIDLATSTYFYFLVLFDDYKSSTHMKKIIKKMESLLLACHTMYNKAPVEQKKGTGSPETDILLCYATSIIYRLGPYVLPKVLKVPPHRTFKARFSKNGTSKGVPVRSTYNNKRPSFRERMKQIEFDLSKKDIEDGIAFTTGVTLIKQEQNNAHKKLLIQGLQVKLNREKMFENYFLAKGLQVLEISKEKKNLHEFESGNDIFI